jgi:hydroxymethylbilane synthase
LSATTPTDKVRIGTRGSALARRQTDLVVEELRRSLPSLRVEIEVIQTLGDETPAADLSQFEGQGIFVRSIEIALLEQRIDVAVHSFKDMPSQQPAGLTIAAFPRREDPRDALVSRDGLSLRLLPPGAAVGTGSPRRRSLLLSLRPDLDVRPLRGNVDTRLRRLAEGAVDAAVLAAAGLARLGQSERIAELLDPAVFLPAVGQGILAIEARAEDARTAALVSQLDHRDTRCCALAERAVAERINAGCHTPIGAYARIVGTHLVLDAVLAADDCTLLRAHGEALPADARALGERVGTDLDVQRSALPSAVARGGS